jgi:hypothetical protein
MARAGLCEICRKLSFCDVALFPQRYVSLLDRVAPRSPGTTLFPRVPRHRLSVRMVGRLFAHPETSFAASEIVPTFRYFPQRSGRHMNFYLCRFQGGVEPGGSPRREDCEARQAGRKSLQGRESRRTAARDAVPLGLIASCRLTPHSHSCTCQNRNAVM